MVHISLSSFSPATPATPMTSMATPVTAVPASLRGRRRTSSSTGRPRDRNLSEASQHSQESSRSTRWGNCNTFFAQMSTQATLYLPWSHCELLCFSPWTEVEDHPVVPPWEPRTFPLTDEEVKQLEVSFVVKIIPIEIKDVSKRYGNNEISGRIYFNASAVPLPPSYPIFCNCVS